MAKDNFTNSIRVAILRDSANKEQNLPQSFIKLADELLGDLVDVTLESNAEIINKVVSILTCLGEFINIERKKEEKKELRQNEINIPEERKQQE